MKKEMKGILAMTGGAVTAGVGGSVLSSIGGTAAGYGATGLANAASGFPAAGSIMGAGAVLGELKKLKV